MSLVAIYALCEFPDLETVRYVGQSVDPKQRLRTHVSAYREHNHRRNWIKQVLASNGAIGCMVIEWVQPEIADIAEQYWIRHLKSRGCRLTNGVSLCGPLPEYAPGADFEPAKSTVLHTMPYRHECEWHEHELVKQGRAMVRAGVDMRAVLNELFWAGIDALLSGAVTLADMKALEEQGRRMIAEQPARATSSSLIVSL